jgi:hypothetical protein
MMKTIFLSLGLLSAVLVSAQSLDYNKKKNTFVINDAPVAKLEPKRNGFGSLRSFFIQDLTEKNMIEYNFIFIEDTLRNGHSWYEVAITSLNLSGSDEGGDGLNGEKYFADYTLKYNLLNKDGSINADACKALITPNSFNHKTSFTRMNDSLKALVSGPRPIVERPTKYPPYVDNMRRIGQGNVVIGKYDMVVIPKPYASSNTPERYVYYIKNNVGTLLSVYEKGRTEYLVFGKKRTTESLNPGPNKEFTGGESIDRILNKIVSDLAYKGLL